MGKYIDLALLRRSIAFAILYSVLFNSSVFLYRFNHLDLPAMSMLITLGKDFVMINIVLVIVFFGLSLEGTLFCLCSLALFLIGSVCSYYLFYFDIAPSYKKISGLYNKGFGNLFSHITIRLVAWISFGVIVWKFAYSHFKASATKLLISRILSALCLLIFINCIISPPFVFIRNYLPFQYLHNSFKYIASLF